MSLPNTYQQVKYIESTGTQCINTNYYWTTENTKIIADFMVTANAGYQSLWGNEEYYSSSSRYFAGIPHGVNYSYAYYLGTGGTTGFSVSQNTRTKIEITTTSSKTYTIKKDDVQIVSSSFNTTMLTRNNANTITDNSGKIFIFANHNSGVSGTTSTATQIIGGMKLYQFQMYDNDTLVRDFMPCYRKSDNVAGLYDLVNNIFYTNSGSGVFNIGPNIISQLLINTAGNKIFLSSDNTIPYVTGITPKDTYEITIPGTHDINNYKYAQVVDANLIASNIREDKSILDINGTLHEGIEPSGTITISDTNLTNVRNYQYAVAADDNLISSNIKNGVNILGTTGNFISSTIITQAKTVTPTAAAQTVTPDAGYTVFSSLTINPVPYTDTLDSHGGHIITIC